ncbi:hypothetical protein [Streptacidiphilus neutrinimicus]|uniref:hypothetical protein n=1 Tax=Streptacidiphilus neutrinimicus TaxID=105420 RepID=UPI0005A74C42|nr:hypothetical protein [Streptacidiphilus neutrinimicus]
MFALPGTRQVLRAIGAHAVRGLAAVEPRGWNRQAQRNAAAAAASARAWRLEAEEADWWTVVHLAAAAPDPAVRARVTRG